MGGRRAAVRRRGDNRSPSPSHRPVGLISIFALLGPTGAGKTAISLDLAERLGAEIVSVDSMQVYRGMDIGTAKATLDERRRVVHHMIDIADPAEPYDVAAFQRSGREAIAGVKSRGNKVLIVGGSGLHFRALVDPMEPMPTDAKTRQRIAAMPVDAVVGRLLEADPEAAEVVDLSNPRRVVRAMEILELTGLTPSHRHKSDAAVRYRMYEPIEDLSIIGIDPGPDAPSRIAARTRAMLDAGLVEEVRSLGPGLGPTAREAVGYKEVLSMLAGTLAASRLQEEIERATMGLVKRQRTFFRRDPRITWLPWSNDLARLAAAATDHWELAP
ncbi:MAG: tRNA (adenosine(37)-N6)-dimethylallyltransferase MiaA [Acidimicrobiia bacterium]|nr:tRNA (adenosine(37)-N6)-dimethylallyltransferase MiaA [Acidimicrobiia bacterium]